MSAGALGERAFEDRVEYELLQRGWAVTTGHYNAELGLETGALWEFVSKTQMKKWNKLLALHGGDQDTAMRQFALRVASEIDARGVLDVLRQGVKDRGVLVDLAYFRPGHTLAADALAEYDSNILTVARQLHFSFRDSALSVDMAFFVNGLPVATVELKNPNTGQGADHAVAQYRERDPNDLFFAKRTLVHFAVDPDRAFITTRLRGRETQFLPFNLGTAGAGNSGGAGNPRPVPPADYCVSYLWRDIWQRDNWLEILQRFVHVQASDSKAGKVNPHTSPRIFPRFHQWHAVQRLVNDARERGAGHNCLVEHSAGSGKSNTIAWLAHRLSNLFGDDNQPVFHKVIVITDRVVLDRQLQRTIFQFDHTPGVVKKIDVDSGQLADALYDSTSKIIISTLQLYPYVLAKITDAGLGGQRYAVIIDEAHSSQGGEAAARLKQALGANAGSAEEDEDPATFLTRVRGPQPNLSYFAFTATPKSATLKLFGTWDPDAVNPREPGERGMHVPFHVYSMKQAIEEGYILDVLANYITYDTKWRLRNLAVEQAASSLSNPEVDERKAKRELVRFAELHPTALDQKAKVIVEDFRDNLAGRLAGRAKAMVVTGGRQHALDLFQALRKWDGLLPGCGFGVLVAFSGSLREEGGGPEFTEAQLNGFPEGQLPDRFGYVKLDDPSAASRGQDEYRLLVVADKYQTGFDQPLLCGMYVDKPLTGVAAVQTLSRLNRIHPLKSQDDVRILDFVNDASDIQTAFEPWFETTITPPTNPNLLYDRQREVMDCGLLLASEMESFIRVLGTAGPGRMPDAAERALHAQLHQYLQPALDRFAALDTDDEREAFRTALRDFVRLYSLIAQIVDWGDPDLERLYQYGRVLLIRLPGRPSVSVDVGDADLSHYRLEFTGAHNVSLSSADGGDGVVRGHSAESGGYSEPELRPLAEIIDELNSRFGLDLGTSDRILVLQQVAGIVEDVNMQQVALMNDEARFGQVADDKLDDIVAENAERNTEFMKLYFDNPEFQKAIKEAARKRAYRIITDPARDEALARLRAEMARETGVLARGEM
jgi:type I restriction enzyme R subunit